MVADALLEAGFRVLGFSDSDESKHGLLRAGVPVRGNDDVQAQDGKSGVRLANGIGVVSGSGSTSLRARVQQRLQAQGWIFISVIHPRTIVSRSARLGEGSQVLGLALSFRQAFMSGQAPSLTLLPSSNMMLSSVTGVKVARRATLCGQTQVGSGSLIGAGAVVRQSITLGEDTIIGAGAVVLRDSPGRETLCGIPARPLGAR